MKRENEVIGSLKEELKQIEEFEKMYEVESEIRTLSAECASLYTIFCC